MNSSGLQPSQPSAQLSRGRLARGFTLIEVMVATAIVAVIISVGTYGVVAINTKAKQLARNAELDQELQIAIEYLVAEAQGAGGGGMRPAGAVRYEPGVHMESGSFVTTAGGPDSITFTFIDDSYPECPIVSFSGVNTVLEESGVCCADAYTTNQYITMVSAAGDLVVGQPFNLLGGCKVNWPVGLFPEFSNAVDLQNKMQDGSVMIARKRRFYLDTTTHQLKVDDIDLDGNLRTRIVAGGVYDLQFALGFDTPVPERDGTVFNNGSAADEWFGNNSADSMGSVPLSTASSTDLRAVMIGLTLGRDATPEEAKPAQLLDGATVSEPGIYLKSSFSRATFRNLYIYN